MLVQTDPLPEFPVADDGGLEQLEAVVRNDRSRRLGMRTSAWFGTSAMLRIAVNNAWAVEDGTSERSIDAGSGVVIGATGAECPFKNQSRRSVATALAERPYVASIACWLGIPEVMRSINSLKT